MMRSVLALICVFRIRDAAGVVQCTQSRTSMCCGDNVCDGPENSGNCAADCTGANNNNNGGPPGPGPPGPGPPGGGNTCTTVPAEKPTVPTLCTSYNQGCCECGTNTKTYIFWPGDGTKQRCFHTYNIPSSAPSGGPVPVVLHMDGYSGGRRGPDDQSDMGTAAKYYGFATITLGNLLKDGAGGFGLEFGNNGVVTDANPTPCSSSDSREIVYLEGVFKFIADNPTLMDSSKVFTEGFSQNSMFAIYTAVCFADKVAGAWQGGSGMSRTGWDPVAPGFQAQCSFTSHATHGNQCCSNEFCTNCQYWPIYPKTCSNKLVDCIMAYTDDAIACGSDWYMYEAMVAEGNDARLLSFPAGSGVGGHQDPQNKWAWLVGCLGVAQSCSSQCATSFSTCINSATGNTSYSKFQTCEAQIKAGSLSGCTSGCAPTLEMLQKSETPVVTLSQGRFGDQTGLTSTSGSAPKPTCTVPFVKFSERAGGPQPKCVAPSSFTTQASSPTVCASNPTPAPPTPMPDGVARATANGASSMIGLTASSSLLSIALLGMSCFSG